MPFPRFYYLRHSIAALLLAGAPVLSLASDLMPPPEADVGEKTFQHWQEAADGANSEWGKGPYLNSLILEKSPYLLQHAGNPVNWLPWSEASLAKAASREQLIVLSIGYSTCHWCHVMNRESFSDPEIARLINRHFVAIKVDREEMPAVDQYYSNVLAMVKGSAGWPLTAILDSAGRPVFIESYLSPDALSNMLNRVIDLGREQPGLIENSARFLAAAIAVPGAASESNSMPLTEDELEELARALLGRMDSEYGGLSGQQKFPNESALAFLSAMRQRQLAPGLAVAVDLQLMSMARGGIYDHVNGGFFRYSTDRYWVVPHFEKMLYNQAMLLGIYSTTYQVTGEPIYRQVVLELIEFLQRWLLAPEGGYYSAISADSQGKEGLYYFWTEAQLAMLPAKDAEEAELITYPAPGSQGLLGAYLGRPDTPAAKRLREALLAKSLARPRPFTDKKIIAAWNATLLSGLVAASQAVAPGLAPMRLDKIEDFANLLWTQLYSPQESSLSRALYRGERVVAGSLEDYAFLAQAFIDLYDATSERIWLERAGMLADLMIEYFIVDGQFVLGDTRKAGTHTRNPLMINDTELPAADAVASGALWRLALRQGNPQLKRQLIAPLSALRKKFRAHPYSNLYAGAVLAEIDLGAVSPHQFFAGGNGQVRVLSPKKSLSESRSCKPIAVAVHLEQGWHVNSATPLQDYLRPTRIRLTQAGKDTPVNIAYPAAEMVKLSFDDESLSVYQGDFRLEISASAPGACGQWPAGATLDVDLQACTDKVCMAPETLSIILP